MHSAHWFNISYIYKKIGFVVAWIKNVFCAFGFVVGEKWKYLCSFVVENFLIFCEKNYYKLNANESCFVVVVEFCACECCCVVNDRNIKENE